MFVCADIAAPVPARALLMISEVNVNVKSCNVDGLFAKYIHR